MQQIANCLINVNLSQGKDSNLEHEADTDESLRNDGKSYSIHIIYLYLGSLN